MMADIAVFPEPRGPGYHPSWIRTDTGNVMRKGYFSAVSLVFLLAAMAGCSSTGTAGDRQSGITMYGTVDAGVSVTR